MKKFDGPETGTIVVRIYAKGWLFRWHWRLFDERNGYTKDRSTKGYFSKWSALRAAKRKFGDQYPIRVDYP